MDRRALAVIAAVTLLVPLARAWFWAGAHPALFSPEELYNYAPHFQWGQLRAYPETIERYQYDDHAGGTLVVTMLGVFVGQWLEGAVALKAVAWVIAGLAGGFFTATAAREGGLRAALVMGAICLVAPLHVWVRQTTALGNHCELLLPIGAVLFAATGRGRAAHLALGVALGFAIWWDRMALLLVPGVAVLALLRRRWEVLPGLVVFPLLMLIPGQDWLPHSANQLGIAWYKLKGIPLLAPVTAPVALAWAIRLAAVGVAIRMVIAARKHPAAALSASFALLVLIAYVLRSTNNPHIQAPVPWTLLLPAAVLAGQAGREALVGALVAGCVLLGSAFDLRVASCPGATDTARDTRSAEWADRLDVWFYETEHVEGLNLALEHSGHEGVGYFFRRSVESHGVFSWSFFGAFDRQGRWHGEDLCADLAEPLPSPEELARALDPGAESEWLEAAGWGLRVRAGERAESILAEAPEPTRDALSRGAERARRCIDEGVCR